MKIDTIVNIYYIYLCFRHKNNKTLNKFTKINGILLFFEFIKKLTFNCFFVIIFANTIFLRVTNEK